MTIPFQHIRKKAAILFGVMAISIVGFYASSIGAQTAYDLSGDRIIKYADCGNPIQFIESSSSISISVVAPFLPLLFRMSPILQLDLASEEILTNKALHTSRYLRNVLYFVVSINAP